jgi:hypothetical protein
MFSIVELDGDFLLNSHVPLISPDFLHPGPGPHPTRTAASPAHFAPINGKAIMQSKLTVLMNFMFIPHFRPSLGDYMER